MLIACQEYDEDEAEEPQPKVAKLAQNDKGKAPECVRKDPLPLKPLTQLQRPAWVHDILSIMTFTYMGQGPPWAYAGVGRLQRHRTHSR
jgi:hypothetical protein